MEVDIFHNEDHLPWIGNPYVLPSFCEFETSLMFNNNNVSFSSSRRVTRVPNIFRIFDSYRY